MTPRTLSTINTLTALAGLAFLALIAPPVALTKGKAQFVDAIAQNDRPAGIRDVAGTEGLGGQVERQINRVKMEQEGPFSLNHD